MIDFDKPVQTRSGVPVRVLCTDAPGPQPVVGIVPGEDPGVEVWSLDGSYVPAGTRGAREPSGRDLINVPLHTHKFVGHRSLLTPNARIYGTAEAAADDGQVIKLTIDEAGKLVSSEVLP